MEKRQVHPVLHTSQTIFIRELPYQANQHSLRRKFSKFGKIVSVKITAKIETSRSRHAFITFKEASSASKAIKSKFLRFWRKELIIEAAQTSKNQSYEINDNMELDNSTLPASSLLDLNDDCLLHLFSFLEVNVQFKLSQLCTRLDYIFEMKFKSNKCIDFADLMKMTLEESQEIIRKCEPNIKSLKYDGKINDMIAPYDRLFQFISETDVDLETIDLVNVESKYIPELLFQKMKNLKILTLSESNISDQICAAFVECKNIEKLNLSKTRSFTGDLRNLKNLIELDLNGCCLRQPYFISLMKSRLKLKNLNIMACRYLNLDESEIIAMVVDNQKLLEDLFLGCSCHTIINIEKLTKLENLKRLTVLGIPELTSFRNFVKEKNSTLESLTTIGRQTHDYKIRQLYEMENLKYLGVSFHSKIDENPSDIKCNGCYEIHHRTCWDLSRIN